MNDYRFKLVKIQGEFVWHSHADTDEVFITVSPGHIELSCMYGHWSQSLTLFPMIAADKLIAPQALLAFGQPLRHRAALKRLAPDHRDALANLR